MGCVRRRFWEACRAFQCVNCYYRVPGELERCALVHGGVDIDSVFHSQQFTGSDAQESSRARCAVLRKSRIVARGPRMPSWIQIDGCQWNPGTCWTTTLERLPVPPLVRGSRRSCRWVHNVESNSEHSTDLPRSHRPKPRQYALPDSPYSSAPTRRPR